VTKPNEPRTQAQVPEDSHKHECARSSFQPILDEPTPERSKLDAALGRLKKCRESLGEEAFRSIQDRLIPKFLNR
jgi:hypothetical protein